MLEHDNRLAVVLNHDLCCAKPYSINGKKLMHTELSASINISRTSLLSKLPSFPYSSVIL